MTQNLEAIKEKVDKSNLKSKAYMIGSTVCQKINDKVE